MPRKSPLTEKQWDQIQTRLLSGEAVRVLAREFGVSDTAIHKRFSLQTKKLKAVVNQVVAADVALKSLPTGLQVRAQTMIDELKAISLHLAGAAKFGSATAHRLAGIANAQIDKISDDDPMEAQETLQAISALTKMANDASVLGVQLINSSNKAGKSEEASIGYADVSDDELQARLKRARALARA